LQAIADRSRPSRVVDGASYATPGCTNHTSKCPRDATYCRAKL